jgi:exodeoxyribonuclease VII small subunit
VKKVGRLSEADITKLSFEEAYERLNEMAGRLERGNLSLEESLTLYEEGVLLSRHCQNLLDQAELRVSQLSPDDFSSVEDEEDNFEDEDEDLM